MSEPTLCPICSQHMDAIGSPAGDWQVYWCPECGTLKNDAWKPKKCVPRVVKQNQAGSIPATGTVEGLVLPGPSPSAHG